MAPIQFILTDLESSVVMGVDATVQTSGEFPVLDTSATAVFQVSVDDMKAVFKYQTDSNDVTNAAGDDIKYYVYNELFPDFNSADAMMDNTNSKTPIATSSPTGPLEANKMLVCHDFVRYLAERLFNTHLGVDLFNNEVELLTNLRSICGDGAEGKTLFDIKAKLAAVGNSGDHADIQGEVAGSKYMTNLNSSPENLCRVLLEQMTNNALSRFAEIDATDAPQSLPFEANDSISFKLIIAPAEGQHELTDVEEIEARSYEIRLDIVASPANTEPAADEV